VHQICHLPSLDLVEGATVDALSRRRSPYERAALRTTEGQALVFAAKSHDLARYFEIFALELVVESAEEFSWTVMRVPCRILQARALWRYEWLGPATLVPGLLGSGPHFTHQTDSRRCAHDASVSARVCAGLELRLSDGSCAVALASASDKFALELATDAASVQELLREFDESAP
jgi:hypothetical protein